MSSRRDHSTQTTGAHRAHSARRAKQHQRTGAAKVFSRSGAPAKADPKSGEDVPVAPGRVNSRAYRAASDAPSPGPAAAGAAGSWSEQPSGGTSLRASAPTVPAAPAAAATRAERGMVLYEPYLDGMFTYCLSVMCEHDAAITAVGEALVLAERQHERDRAPAQRSLHRPWMYALARWVCLRRLAEQSRRDNGSRDTVPATAHHLSDAARTRRRRELAALAWPEAAGTSPEQREALELAVRHGLPAPEVAAVLSLTSEAASALLSSAACEVERTRAALAVVKAGGCPAVAGLAGEDQLLLGPAFRRELVRHVDECTNCRRTAERAMSGVAWPGTAPAGTAELAVLEAPRRDVEAAVLAVRRARARHIPRFDRTGFPVEVKDRAARRDRLRSRAVTTTVVATVVAAPVLALWAAYRGAPFTGEPDSGTVSAADRDEESVLRGRPYENAAQDGSHGHGDRGKRHGAKDGDSRKNKDRSAGDGAKDGADDGKDTGAGRLTVDARPVGGATLIRLTASGSSPVRWSMSGGASWLTFSSTSGVLRPGESATVRVSVLRSREPSGPWSADIRVAPSGAVVTIQGRGTGPTPPSDPPPSDDPSTPPPSDPPPSDDPTTPPPSDPPPSDDPSTLPS